MLEEIDVAAVYEPNIKPEDVGDKLKDFDGLIVRSKMKINADTVAKASKLKFVARAGAGVDNIDIADLQARGIALISANEGNSQAVGEHTVGMLLSLMRNIVRSDREVRNKIWLREENRGGEISGKTVGIIGYGNMGQSLAKLLSGFGCTILAYDRYAPEKITYPATSVTLEELQHRADIVSLHIPFIPENHHFADGAFFSGFSRKIWFVNTSRGEVVEQTALVEHLQTGQVKGAALDVLENEKLGTLSEQQADNFTYLSNARNVVLTPHIAGWTHESYIKINQVLADKIAQLL